MTTAESGNTPGTPSVGDHKMNQGAFRFIDGSVKNADGSVKVRIGVTPQKHRGIWATAFLQGEDESTCEKFSAIRAALADDFPHENMADSLGLDLTAIYAVKIGQFITATMKDSKERAQFIESIPAINTFDGLLRSHLKELKATRASKGGKGGKGKDGDGDSGGPSPAEFASSLLAGDDDPAPADTTRPAAGSDGQPYTRAQLDAIKDRVRQSKGSGNTKPPSHNTDNDPDEYEENEGLF